MDGLWQWLRNFFSSTDTLTPSEEWLLRNLLDRLPQHLRPIAQAQVACHDRRQREVGDCAINFYRSSRAQGSFPLLSMSVESVPLIRITVAVAGEDAPVHATLIAVVDRVFTMHLNRPVMTLSPDALQVTHVKDSWRSNFPRPKECCKEPVS